MFARSRIFPRILRGLAPAAGLVLLCAVCGCADESVTQSTELGDWIQSPDSPTVISGNPDRDAAAFAETERQLSEADWRRLEEIAPRPIWERLEDAHKALQGEREQQEQEQDDSPALRLTPEDQDEEAEESDEQETPEARRDARILNQGEENIRIFYRLQHYGGTKVQSDGGSGTQRRNVSLSEADLAPVVSLVSEEVDGGSVSALVDRNTIVVTCSEDQKEAVLELLDTIDQPNKQAEITARIFEVSHDFDFQIGVESILEHLGSDQEHSLITTLNPARFLEALEQNAAGGFQGSVLRLLQVFEGAGVTLDVAFQALVNEGLVNVVASPRMTVASGETAYMLAGREIPIQSGRISGDNFVTEQVTYKPVGVQLYITPRAISDDVVKMHLITVVSTVEGFSPRRTVGGMQDTEPIVNPIINSREAETSVTVGDGDTLVVGGLRMVREITREEKMPGLGDIWGLEWLFKKHRAQRELSDLYFFVTPRLVSR